MPHADQRLTFRAAVTQVVLVKGQKEAQLLLSCYLLQFVDWLQNPSPFLIMCFTRGPVALRAKINKTQEASKQNGSAGSPSPTPPDLSPQPSTPPPAPLIHKGFKWQLKNKTPLLSCWTYVLCWLPVWPVSCVWVHSLPHRPPSGSHTAP